MGQLVRRGAKPKERTESSDHAGDGAPHLTEELDLVEEHGRFAQMRERLLANAAAIASLVVLAFMLLKVELVAKGDVSTALAVVAESNALTVFLGTVVYVLPALTLWFSAGMMAARRDRNLTELERRWLFGLYGSAAIWLSFVVHWSSTLAVIIYAVAIAMIDWRRKRKGRVAVGGPGDEPMAFEAFLKTDPQDVVLRAKMAELRSIHGRLQDESTVDLQARRDLWNRKSAVIDQYNARVRDIRKLMRGPIELVLVSVFAASLVPLTHTQLLTGRPWVPAETITLTDGSNRVGYVLDDGQAWVPILLESPRRVEYIPADKIANRTICVPPGATLAPTRTIWRIAARTSVNYARCP